MMSFNTCYTQEAVAELHGYFEKKVAYLNPSGGLRASAAVDTVERVLVALSHRRKAVA